MEFQKYNSIENSYREKFLELINLHMPEKTRWVVQEKIHGANLQIGCDGKDVIFGSRNKPLPAPEDIRNFYRLDSISDFISGAVIELFMNLKYSGRKFKQIIVYGELFGGKYPGYDSQVPMVQKGVVYTPKLEFCAFDVKLIDDDGNQSWLDVHDCNKHLDLVCLFRPKILTSGSLDECLAYPNDGESIISNQLGYKSVGPENIMEGVVIRPEVTAFLPSGSRVILKNKNVKFSEKKQTKKKIKTAVPVSENLQNAIDVLGQYMNENRLNAVLSKFPADLQGKDVFKAMGELIKDAMEDIKKDCPEVLEALTPEEAKQLGKKEGMVIARPLVLAAR